MSTPKVQIGNSGSTRMERCDAHNNIFYVTARSNTVSLLDSNGTLDLTDNWLKPGWVRSFGDFRGVVNDDGTAVVGASPASSTKPPRISASLLAHPTPAAGDSGPPQT